MNLTKDAYKTLCIIYKEYLIKCDTLSKSDAKEFTENDLENLLCDFNFDDLDDILNELESVDFISRDIIGNVSLTSDGIICMENRFKKGFKDVTDFITKFIP